MSHVFDGVHKAVSMVSRYMADPGKEHWNAVKWIFRYLAGTRDFGIMFDQKVASTIVMGYVDADYAEDLDSRRSMTGCVHVCWWFYLLEVYFTGYGCSIYHRSRVYGSDRSS